MEENQMSTVRELIPKKVGKLPKSGHSTTWPLTQNVEDMFEHFFNRFWMEPFNVKRPMMREFESPLEMRYPLVDLVDRDNELVVRAELPGVKKNEIELAITDEGLTITVDRELKEEEKTDRFYRCELAHGALERTVMFPIDVEIDKAKAQLKEGVLEIVIPKLKSVKRRVLKVA
jgi:HSP20 family protein